MTHGDRRATETRDLSRFNIDNKYGRSALESTMRAIMGYEAPIVPPPKDYKGDFFKGSYSLIYSQLYCMYYRLLIIYVRFRHRWCSCWCWFDREQ